MEQAVDQRGGEAVALELAQLLVEGVSLLGRLEAVDPLLGGREGDAVTRLARLELEGDGGVAFSRSGRPEEADVGPLLDPGEPGEVEDTRALGREATALGGGHRLSHRDRSSSAPGRTK